MTRKLDLTRLEVVDKAMADVLRQKTPAERIAMALDANETARLLLEGHFRSYHPEWDDARIAEEIAKRMLRETG
jgi:hypothetical protein